MSDEESRPAKRTYRWSPKRVTSENRRDSESNYLEDVDSSKLRVTKLPLPRNTLLQAASRYTSKVSLLCSLYSTVTRASYTYIKLAYLSNKTLYNFGNGFIFNL